MPEMSLPLPTGYRAIVADPPWAFNDRLTMSEVARGAAANYATLTSKEIRQLPVAELANTDALCVVWVPSALLATGIEVLDAWGFTLKQTWIWAKTGKALEGVELEDAPVLGGARATPGLAFGMGRVARNCHELALVGTRGRPAIRSKSVRTVFMHPALPHSRKPETVQDAVEALVEGPYLELFARRQRPGWTCLGNEAPWTVGQDIRESLAALRGKVEGPAL